MKKYLLVIFVFTICNVLLANDGSFYASGNTLIPLKETVIHLKKEILDLTYNGGFMQVNIYFEFMNPGEEKNLTVGFVTPPAAGDVRDDEIAHPQIKDFFVQVNSQLLEYKIAKMNGTGFKVSTKLAEGNDFVYYFNVKFKKGMTVIKHSYAYRGGANVENIYDYAYRLTTGTSWAGNAIDDFELNIRMEDDCIFGVPFQFTKKQAKWEIIGIGKISSTPRYNAYDDPDDQGSKLSVVFIKRGYLQLKTKEFKPESDLSVVITGLHNEVNWWCDKNKENVFSRLNELYYRDSAASFIKSLTNIQLRLYRNLDYARNGYDFKDSMLKKTFLNYFWYIPDPSFKIENATEKYLNKQYMDLIIAEEKRRKLSN
jgi:hypothetical protein